MIYLNHSFWDPFPLPFLLYTQLILFPYRWWLKVTIHISDTQIYKFEFNIGDVLYFTLHSFTAPIGRVIMHLSHPELSECDTNISDFRLFLNVTDFPHCSFRAVHAS